MSDYKKTEAVILDLYRRKGVQIMEKRATRLKCLDLGRLENIALRVKAIEWRKTTVKDPRLE